MNNELFDIYTLIFLVIAVIIFLRLRSVLGRRTGNERPPYDPYSTTETDQNNSAPAQTTKTAGNDNVVQLPTESDATVYGIKQTKEEEIAEKLKNFAPENSPLEENLKKIIEADDTFIPSEFVNGAKAAYEIIVMAFAESNKKALKPLLDKDVYESFVKAIDDRTERKETVDSSFVGIDKAVIIDAELKDNFANITIKFVSEIITAVINKNGKVIEGDPEKICDVTDIWTFSRNIKSSNPNWLLVSTQTAN